MTTDSNERVITAVFINVYFVVCLFMAFLIPPAIWGYIAEHGNTPGYGPVGTPFEKIAWWDLCAELYRLWENLVMLLPVYAIVQASPNGAFDFILKRKAKGAGGG